RPTQSWPSLAGPSSAPAGDPPAASPTPTPTNEPASPPAPASSTPTPSTPSPFEPAPSMAPTHVATVEEDGVAADAAASSRSRTRLRWGLALVGVLIVAAASFLIVSLVGGRPATSTAMGYMPSNTIMYSEVRLDLPGDQRQKLASFLAAFPSFKDQSAIDPKIDELFDRVIRAASHDKQTWTTDIKPWFGGQLAAGVGIPNAAALGSGALTGANNS